MPINITIFAPGEANAFLDNTKKSRTFTHDVLTTYNEILKAKKNLAPLKPYYLNEPIKI